MRQENKVSIRAYARSLNVDDKAVRKAIDAGLIKKGYDATLKKIIPAKADKEWGFQHKVVKPRAGVSRAKAIEKMEQQKPSAPQQPTATKTDPESEDIDKILSDIKITSSMSAADAMKYREIIGVALDKKKLEEQEAILVRRDKVEKALFAVGNELKKALFNMPQRIVRDIMSCPNEVEAINIFNEELTILLNNYANLKLPQLN